MLIAVGLGVFAAATALDFATARYAQSIKTNDMHRAGLWSVAMCLLATIALLALVDVSRWMLVPECAGLYLGTRLAGRGAGAASR